MTNLRGFSSREADAKPLHGPTSPCLGRIPPGAVGAVGVIHFRTCNTSNT